MGTPFFRHRANFHPRSGGSLKRLDRPNRLKVSLHGLNGGRVRFNIIPGVDPGYPQRGPYKAPEGICPVTGEQKLGVGKDRKGIAGLVSA